MMGNIFKSYDIRGLYPSQINEDIIYKIGRAYADLLKSQNMKNDISIVVGQDMRTSSPSLSKCLIEGIIKQGANVIDIGLSSTPTLYFGVSFLGVDGGMQVSASHNPKDYNGVKIVKKKALPVGYDTGIDIIEQKVNNNDFTVPDRKGIVSYKEDILNNEVAFSLKKASVEKISLLKIVADPANAMGSLYLSELFEKLPCELIKMNFKLDGTFPVHEADPFKDENIEDIRKKVVEEKADLGIATDGDGDRIFFIDNEGLLVEPAILRAIMAKLVLKEQPGATICYDIRPGKITRDVIVENQGIPSVTKVGHTLIKIQAIEENAAFAGESSGHFFFNTEIGMFEMPMVVILKLLVEICESGKCLSDLVNPMRKYFHSGEINSEVEDKEAKMEELGKIYSDAKISWLDGITIEYDDFWFNVRPSNTESLLRLNLEAVSKKTMDEKRDEILNIIKST
jgi:phosphomannomutase